MKVVFTKGSGKYGYLKCIRTDDSTTETQMPEQGIAPHDMIHFIVEKTLGFEGAFYGQLKAGANISFTMEHNETSRSAYNSIETWQTESIVESLQSLLWSSSFEYDDFSYLVNEACASRKLTKPVISEIAFNAIKEKLLTMNKQWQSLTKGESVCEVF